MRKSFKEPNPEQSRGEEVANSLSHGIGFLAAVVATPLLLAHVLPQGEIGFLVGVSLFAASMLLLYFVSTFYHALPKGRAKSHFKVLDHSVIYLLIAGTYMPFTLGVLRGGWGWTLMGIVSGLALIGVTLKLFDRISHPVISTSLYLFMGWLIVIAINPLVERISTSGLLWLIAGGVAYTAGVIFFALDSRLQYGHFIWHLFVLTGTSCHFCAVFWCAAGQDMPAQPLLTDRGQNTTTTESSWISPNQPILAGLPMFEGITDSRIRVGNQNLSIADSLDLNSHRWIDGSFTGLLGADRKKPFIIGNDIGGIDIQVNPLLPQDIP